MLSAPYAIQLIALFRIRSNKYQNGIDIDKIKSIILCLSPLYYSGQCARYPKPNVQCDRMI